MSNNFSDPVWTETERLAALASYAILDTPQEKVFDDAVQLLSRLLDAPIAAVNLIAQGRQWFKSEIGLGVREMPLDDSICKIAILQDDRMIVPDTLEDSRFNCNPLVTGAPGLRFYAGEVLKTPEGLPLGTLCVLDTKPRPEGLTEEQQFALQTLSQQIVSQLELHKLVHEQNRWLAEQRQTTEALRLERDRSQQILQSMEEGFILLDKEFRVQEINAGALKMENRPASEIVGRSLWEAWPGLENLPIAQAYKQAMQESMPMDMEQRYVFPDGRIVWLDVRAYPVHEGLAIFYRNITERKRNQALAEGQRKALEMAVTEVPLQEVLNVLTRFAEDQLDNAALISVLLLDQDAKHLRHGAAPSLPEEYVKAIDGVAIGPAVGSCGTAAYLNQEVIVSDIENDPLWSNFKGLALAHNLRSCWSQPIRSPEGKVLGTLACYWQETHVPTKTEMESLALLVSTAALILDHRRETEARKATQDALRRNAERFQSFVAATSQIIWTTNAEGYVIEDSPSWRAFTGQTYDEWKNYGWLDVIHPDDREQTISAWENSLARKEVFRTEYRMRQADGTYRWSAVRGVPVLNQDGSIREWVGANTDITKRKQDEIERNRFVSLAERSNDFIGMADLNLQPFFVNRSGLEMVGLDSLEQALQTPVVDFFFPEDQSFIVNEFFPRAIKDGAGEVEIRFRHFKTGEALWMIYSVYVVEDENGNVIGHATVSRNITERKHAEAALHASRERFQKIVSQAATGVVQTDTDNRITLVNQKFCDMLGYDEAELLGVSVVDITAPNFKPQSQHAISRAVAEGSGFVVEKQYRRKDGSLIWATSSVNSLHGPAGEYEGLVAMIIDITDRKQAEDELRRLAAHLSEANRRKTEFLATLAHELRNPLAPIRNGLEVLRLAGNNPATATKVQDMMQRQVNHMVHLINDLLDVARISSGKVELKKELVELKSIIASAMESSLPLIDAAHHALDVHIPDASILLHADQTRLVQVIGNLLTNAAKYTPDGGRIELTVRPDGNDVTITVSDTGIGIPATALPAVFEMFAQVPNNAGRTQGGLGIGLSLVQRLVEMHGGTVTATSPGEGKGSTFTIRLPLARTGRNDTAAVQPQDTRISDGNYRTLRIIVADDNTDAADSLATVLRLGGHETSVAHDGHAALKQALEVRPEVIFLDIGMPGMTGYEVAKEIRKIPGMEATILVALTGWGAQHDQAMAKAAGFNHHLTKPADLNAINTVLQAS